MFNIGVERVKTTIIAQLKNIKYTYFRMHYA